MLDTASEVKTDVYWSVKTLHSSPGRRSSTVERRRVIPVTVRWSMHRDAYSFDSMSPQSMVTRFPSLRGSKGEDSVSD